MKRLTTAILAIALALSWLGFWTYLSSPEAKQATDRRGPLKDTVTVWISELIGSPEEAYYYELADLWNATHETVRMKLSVMSYAGYHSKLRVAIASGQPPDVCSQALETLESLKYTGKAGDLATTIPEAYFPETYLDSMGSAVTRSIVRDGRPTVFPVYKYCYGGVMLANRAMIEEAGFDADQIRQAGWTFDQFREACRKMTRDLDGDGAPDTWGFGAATVHVRHLFLEEFGPGVWGRDVGARLFLAQDPATGQWGLHPDLTEEQVYQVILLLHQLLNEDKTWNPETLGMNWNEILDELVVHRRMGLTFGEAPWVAKMRRELWEREKKDGLREGTPPDLTVVWMPTLHPGDRPAPRMGVVGINVLKQTPYKGDAHTENALRVAHYLTHPVHLARSQLRQFRHLPPETERFGGIYPELVQDDDAWVAFYNDVMESDIPLVVEPLAGEEARIEEYVRLRAAVDRWLEKKGVGYIEQVLYRKLMPEEGARLFFSGLKAAVPQAAEPSM